MNSESRLELRPTTGALAAVVLIAAGAAATYVAMGRPEPPPAPSGARAVSARSSTAGPQTSTPPAGNTDVSVSLTPEVIKRAGIETQPVSVSAAGRIRVPGIVQPNAYRTTVVTSLVGGRITRVSAELGQSVRRGQTLAEVYSPELAEAQTRFIASRAELEAHDLELRRTERLVEIGAASRQDLERIHAEHTAATTMVQSNRSRLTLLSMSDAQIATLASAAAPTVSIPSPLDGVVTTRETNPGMNVDPASRLFTVADLSTVWIAGDLNERDLARVRIGSPVTITSVSMPGSIREGTVSYIDPDIKADTRTAQFRVQIPNPGQQLRLGMYVDVEVGDRRPATETALMVPRSAVQVVGDRSVVYLAVPGQPGQFTERAVETGETVGDSIQIRSGLAGDTVVVTKGSFAVRAEAERLGVRSRPVGDTRQEARIIVSEKGFAPSRLSLRAGVPARLTFLRTADATCATEVVIASLNVKRTLPLNQPIEFEFTPEKSGDITFACGMAMFSGTIVVE